MDNNPQGVPCKKEGYFSLFWGNKKAALVPPNGSYQVNREFKALVKRLMIVDDS